MENIKNLIFDLGGVILDLSVKDTLESFAVISGHSIQQVQNIFITSQGFEQYERGELTDQEFRDFVRDVYHVAVPDAEIDRCWNAMLLGIPKVKLDLLLALKKHFKIFLLSNTNTIHLNYINQKILPAVTGENSLEPFFHGSYYSHLMGKRKPEVAIYKQVLDENDLVATETLFLDDNTLNVEGAKQVGLQAVWVDHQDFVLSYFDRYSAVTKGRNL